MLLLTGATGQVGSVLLGRLLGEEQSVRCLVRDPRRLGTQRVRVQIALGDLSDPLSFRNAMRGVDTVVHLAASIRDQPQGSIEELNGIATWRMVHAARQAGVRRFVFFSVLGASPLHRTRFCRSKTLAEQAVADSGLQATIFSPSIIYTPGDRWLTVLELISRAGITPVPGRGRTIYQPIFSEDAADCVAAALRAPPQPQREGQVQRYELAGPDILSHDEMVRIVLRYLGRRQALMHVPWPIVSRALQLAEKAMGERAFATADEAELMETSMVSRRGTADALKLGVQPRRMETVLEP